MSDLDDDYETDESQVEKLEDVEYAVTGVEEAIRRVELAIKDQWTTGKIVAVLIVVYLLLSWTFDIWYSKWRYALSYGVDADKVTIDTRPHDCNFLAAPIGDKYCDYERQVSTVRWATSMEGNPIVSYDEGKTWDTFTPDGTVPVPKQPTVEAVFVTWKKIEK